MAQSMLFLGLGFLLFMIFFVNLQGFSTSDAAGVQLRLTRIDSKKGGYSTAELIRRGVRRSRSRAVAMGGRFSSSSSSKADGGSSNEEAQFPSLGIHFYDEEFVVDFNVGTPGFPSTAIADTGSDLIWVQCTPCIQCLSQSLPLYDPSNSQSFSPLPCDNSICQILSGDDGDDQQQHCGNSCFYSRHYGDGSTSSGFLGTETLTLGGVPFPGIAFGCSNNVSGDFSNSSGIVGLGRGPPSLISQLGIQNFSYCLTSYDDSKPSILSLGSPLPSSVSGRSSNVPAAQVSTPLLTNPAYPSFYYVNLLGLSVGGTRLDIPKSTFELREDGGGGTFFDSGTSFTSLDSLAFEALAESFASQVNLNQKQVPDSGFDECFELQGSGPNDIQVPKLVFHFEGMDLDLPLENYIFSDKEEGYMCLAIVGSKKGRPSIFGNFQMQNMAVTYDLAAETISVVPAICDEL